ncbi:hypothetical protein D3C72_1133550 [compost metagenome]
MDVGQVQRRELLHDVGEQRLRVAVVRVVGGRDGRQADAGLAAADGVDHGARGLEQQARAVLDGAAVVVGALVAAVFQELVEQVAVGAVQLHAVEARGLDGVACGRGIGVDDAGQLGRVERARLRGFDKSQHAVLDEHGLGLGGDGRGRDGLAATGLQFGVRDAAHVPQLHDDLAALGVHGVGHALPAFELFGAVEAGHVGVALALVADGGGFGDEQAGAGALGVVGGGDVGRDRVGRAVARERRHHDAVGELEVAGLDGVEKGGHRGLRGQS